MPESAALFLGALIAAGFPSAGNPKVQPQAPFNPPTQAPLTWSTEREDCIDGGWRDFAQFASEQECTDCVDS